MIGMCERNSKGFTLLEGVIILFLVLGVFTAGVNSIWDWFQEHIWDPFVGLFTPDAVDSEPYRNRHERALTRGPDVFQGLFL